ncbi:MAG: hypothetical protein RSG52_07315 [Terrisporobacter sp.]
MRENGNSKKRDFEKPCLCDKQSYNNINGCYLKPKDVNIIQVNDSTLFQVIRKLNNLCLTSTPVTINTGQFSIESSTIERLNDTLYINESGLYSIYFSLTYSFKFNEEAVSNQITKLKFSVRGNGKEQFNIENIVNIPIIEDGESEEIINTVQSYRLIIVNEKLPYKLNICLKEFDFDLASLDQIIISDFLLIVEKII